MAGNNAAHLYFPLQEEGNVKEIKLTYRGNWSRTHISRSRRDSCGLSYQFHKMLVLYLLEIWAEWAPPQDLRANIIESCFSEQLQLIVLTLEVPMTYQL